MSTTHHICLHMHMHHMCVMHTFLLQCSYTYMHVCNREGMQQMASREYKFIREPDDVLKCAICLEVARDPHQHEECGKLFCKECIEKYGRDKPCPHCRTQGSQYFRDNRSKYGESDTLLAFRKLFNVLQAGGISKIFPYAVILTREVASGISALREHVVTCGFTSVPCPKECEDGDGVAKTFQRRDITKHLQQDCPNRDHVCEHCGEEGTHHNITEIHDPQCHKKVISCTNVACSRSIPREDLKRHLEKCGHTVIACKYNEIGCEVEMERRNMASHEQDQTFHLQFALDAVAVIPGVFDTFGEELTAALTKGVEELGSDLESALESIFEESAHTLKKNEPLTFAVCEYHQKKENDEKCGPSFYTSPGGYHMSIEVYANGLGNGKGSHVSVYFELLKGKYDSYLNFPFKGKIALFLLNQLEDRNHRSLVIDPADNMQINSSWGYSKFATHSALAHDPAKNTQYLKDDRLFFRVLVEVADYKPWLECTV